MICSSNDGCVEFVFWFAQPMATRRMLGVVEGATDRVDENVVATVIHGVGPDAPSHDLPATHIPVDLFVVRCQTAVANVLDVKRH